ncbi:hypothetical protein SlGVgp083 [Spodoptera litura granulovirus]|uniref:P33 n=1 Tax=Spodoptera litura granulovirus TaxID=359919 RepID=A5IZT5_9BBAC|nr:hypothetical protein SlGVgp083 [Spodoptera litura granulovirus]ABQ52026.1 hypothetical protein SlGVgp083 [Spodoptera litura granulovirus]
MITDTQLMTRYVNSFLILSFRMLDLTRVAPVVEIKSILIKETKFLYTICCLLIYGNAKVSQCEALVEWGAYQDPDANLDVVQKMYMEKLSLLGLGELNVNKYTFSFTTIWDSMHLLCHLGDSIVQQRHSLSYEQVSLFIKNLKWIFYNIFIILFCPRCAKHYITVNTLTYEIERVELALYREKMGEPIIMVNEETRSMAVKNTLLTNHLLYQSMKFHNHINGYRPIQTGNDELNKFQRMDWNAYRTLLGLD